MGRHLDGCYAYSQRVMPPRRCTQCKVEHAHQGPAMDVTAAIDQLGVVRKTCAGIALFNMFGLHPDIAHERNIYTTVWRVLGAEQGVGWLGYGVAHGVLALLLSQVVRRTTFGSEGRVGSVCLAPHPPQVGIASHT